MSSKPMGETTGTVVSGGGESLEIVGVEYQEFARIALKAATSLIDSDPLMAALYAGLAKSCLAVHCGQMQRNEDAAAGLSVPEAEKR